MVNLPNFLVVGSTKAGTTSLYNYLLQHPEVYLNKGVKESNFFVEPKDILGCGPRFCGKNSYGVNFDNYSKLFVDVNPETHKAIGEICTTYLHFSDHTIPSIKKYLKDPKIIIILRNPVDRAYSHYMHNVRDGDEYLAFEDALKAEERRKKEKLWLSFYLKELGLYYGHVVNYLHNFENVKVLIYEDMIKDMDVFMNDLFSFLEITSIKIDHAQKYNISGLPKHKLLHNFVHGNIFLGQIFLKLLSYVSTGANVKALQNYVDSRNLVKSSMSESSRKELEQFYYEDVLKLSSLLNIDLNDKWNIKRH